jgi:PDZ domain-containing secreted protein
MCVNPKARGTKNVDVQSQVKKIIHIADHFTGLTNKHQKLWVNFQNPRSKKDAGENKKIHTKVLNLEHFARNLELVQVKLGTFEAYFVKETFSI